MQEKAPKLVTDLKSPHLKLPGKGPRKKATKKNGGKSKCPRGDYWPNKRVTREVRIDQKKGKFMGKKSNHLVSADKRPNAGRKAKHVRGAKSLGGEQKNKKRKWTQHKPKNNCPVFARAVVYEEKGSKFEQRREQKTHS